MTTTATFAPSLPASLVVNTDAATDADESAYVYLAYEGDLHPQLIAVGSSFDAAAQALDERLTDRIEATSWTMSPRGTCRTRELVTRHGFPRANGTFEPGDTFQVQFVDKVPLRHAMTAASAAAEQVTA